MAITQEDIVNRFRNHEQIITDLRDQLASQRATLTELGAQNTRLAAAHEQAHREFTELHIRRAASTRTDCCVSLDAPGKVRS